MKIKDILRISTKNVKVYRKRNFLVVATVGVIFSLIFAMNLWFQGVKQTYCELAREATDGKVVILAINESSEISLQETSEPVTREEMVADIEAFGGEVLGDAEGLLGQLMAVLPEELVAGAIEVDMDTVPEDAVPLLVSVFAGEKLLDRRFPTVYTKASDKQADYEKMYSDLIGETIIDRYGAKYFIIGFSADNFQVPNLSFTQLERSNTNLLNSVLELISTPDGEVVAVDNGKMANWQKGEELALPEGLETVVAVFEDAASARNYYQNGKGQFANTGLTGRSYSVNVVAGMSPESEQMLNLIETGFNIVSVVLGLIAMVVVIFTSIRLVDQDKQNIELYYSLGATTKQVRAIYRTYFLELMTLSVIFAFALASVAVLLFSLFNQELLSIQAELSFALSSAPTIIWYGVNYVTFIIIFAMLFIAEICVLVNRKRLSIQ